MNESPAATVDPRALGARLREAREARGWTQQVVAERLAVARTTMVAIEKGERRLRPEELMQLAGLYGRPVSELVQRRAPVEGFTVQLRSALAPAEPIDSELLPHIEEFQHLCEDYLRLEELCDAPLRRRYPAEYELGAINPELAAEDIADAERNRLGLGDGPLLNLRETLEGDVGLRIFQLALPSKVAGMFAFTDPTGGCIAVNLHHPEERRRLGIAHQYGHFLTTRYRSEVTLVERYERRPSGERFAESFTRALLLPAAGTRRRFLDLERERPHGITVGDLCRLAHFYAVSFEAMTRRLEELRLIPVGTWDRIRRERFQVREAQRFLGLAPAQSDEEILPRRYVLLAIEAWQRGELTEGQLARFLRTDRLGAREWVRRLEGTSSDETGPATMLDLGAPLVGSATG